MNLLAIVAATVGGAGMARADEPPKNPASDKEPVVIVEFVREYRTTPEKHGSGIPSGRLPSAGMGSAASATKPSPPANASAEPLYTCPMHPQIQWPRPDPCPLCGMRLESNVRAHTNGSQARTDQGTMTSLGRDSVPARAGTVARNRPAAMRMMNHSAMGGMPMNSRSASTPNHANMAMQNDAPISHGSGTAMIDCPTCTRMLGGTSHRMGDTPMNGAAYSRPNHTGMRMDRAAIQGHEDTGHSIMGRGACMEMMRSMNGMNDSMGGMTSPDTVYREPQAPMPTMPGRCGC
jgi:hypothetical protein